MQQTVTVTSKWQVHIPIEARKKMQLTYPPQMKVEVVNDALVLTPKKSTILQMAGSLSSYVKKRPDINIDRIRDHIDYSET
ncbi:MAG: AbrB/MazE/SpoVT family DNA-binding domain-containing protein [Patescibacteria group bacterium]|nr:AbrB/MazE/SpoVT family DNA-binding domain-containing protein [Patescibacteria group bacterium]